MRKISKFIILFLLIQTSCKSKFQRAYEKVETRYIIVNPIVTPNQIYPWEIVDVKTDSLFVIIDYFSNDSIPESEMKNISKSYILKEIELVSDALLFKNKAWLNEYRADLYYSINDFKKTIPDLVACIDSGRTSSIIYYRKGMCEYILGNYKNSINDLTKSQKQYQADLKQIFNNSNFSSFDHDITLSISNRLEEIDTIIYCAKKEIKKNIE